MDVEFLIMLPGCENGDFFYVPHSMWKGKKLMQCAAGLASLSPHIPFRIIRGSKDIDCIVL